MIFLVNIGINDSDKNYEYVKRMMESSGFKATIKSSSSTNSIYELSSGAFTYEFNNYKEVDDVLNKALSVRDLMDLKYSVFVTRITDSHWKGLVEV